MNSVAPPQKCVVCDHTIMQPWGEIHKHSSSAERKNGADLYYAGMYQTFICTKCSLVMKSPTPDADALAKYYANTSEGEWGINNTASIRHFDLLETIALNSSRLQSNFRVLDYGCSNGELLKSWGNKWKKFGVEPSQAASTLANKNGLTIIDPKELENYHNHFDVIVCVDVIEHILEPKEEVQNLLSTLRTGGKLIFITGNASNIAFKVAKGGYWYCDIPEHVVFFSVDSFKELGRQLSMRMVDVREISHLNIGSHAHHFKQSLKFVAFLIFKHTLGRLFRTKTLRTTYPNLASAKDHLVVTFEKS